jgi:hypothetical protein
MSNFKSALQSQRFYDLVEANLKKIGGKPDLNSRIAIVQNTCNEISDKLGIPRVKVVAENLPGTNPANYYPNSNKLEINSNLLSGDMSKAKLASIGRGVIHEMVHAEQANLVSRYEAKYQNGKSSLAFPLSPDITKAANEWLKKGGTLTEQQRARALLIQNDFSPQGMARRKAIDTQVKISENNLILAANDYNSAVKRGNSSEIAQKRKVVDLALKANKDAIDGYKKINIEDEAYKAGDLYREQQNRKKGADKLVSQGGNTDFNTQLILQNYEALLSMNKSIPTENDNPYSGSHSSISENVQRLQNMNKTEKNNVHTHESLVNPLTVQVSNSTQTPEGKSVVVKVPEGIGGR